MSGAYRPREIRVIVLEGTREQEDPQSSRPDDSKPMMPGSPRDRNVRTWGRFEPGCAWGSRRSECANSGTVRVNREGAVGTPAPCSRTMPTPPTVQKRLSKPEEMFDRNRGERTEVGMVETA